MLEYETFVVARMMDGELVRGSSSDLDVTRPFFHITEDGSSQPFRVEVQDLKAIFFVKSFRGNPDHVENKTFGSERTAGRKIWVEFTDGEELAGWCADYRTEAEGFHLFPPDPNSNIEKAYIPSSAVKRVVLDEQAVEASRKYKPKQKSTAPPIGPVKWDNLLPATHRRAQLLRKGAKAASKKRASSEYFLGEW
jgi:hypothetical protein